MSDSLPPQPPLPPWEQQPDQRPSRPNPHGPRDEAEATPGVRAKPRQSILRSGPDSFSLTSRLVISGIIVAVGIGLYLLSGSLVFHLGSTGMAMVMLLLGLFVVIGGGLLWALWKPGRIDDPTARPQLTPQERAQRSGGPGAGSGSG